MATRVRVGAMLVLVLGLGAVARVADAVSPAQTCQASKNKEAGRYANCRYKAEARFATRGDAAAYQLALEKCAYKLAVKWPLLESKAGGMCQTTGDQEAIQGAIDTHTTNVATALAGGVLPDCPGDLLALSGRPRHCTGDLGTCQIDLTATQGSLTPARHLTPARTTWRPARPRRRGSG